MLEQGKGGQDATEELLCFDTDIFARPPALVICQVGTNAVFHSRHVRCRRRAADIETGLKRLCADRTQMDAMLIDRQDLTAMLLDDKAELSGRMVRLIAEKMDQADVGVFHRWALMWHWHVHNSICFERMLDPTDPDQAQSLKFSGFSLSELQICHAIVRQHDPRVLHVDATSA